MHAIPEPNPEQNELSSRAGQAKSATDKPTTEKIGLWDENRLFKWIQEKLPIPLKDEDGAKFLNAGIDGTVFLRGADDKKFFQDAGLSFGASVKLAELARETRDSEQAGDTGGKLSNQTAGEKRKGDEIDQPEPPISPRKHRRKLRLSELATRANEQRKLVWKTITDLSSSSDQHSNSDYPLPGAVAQLSNPKMVHKLPFPFVGSEVPVRFKLGNEAELDSETEMDNEAELDSVAELDNEAELDSAAEMDSEAELDSVAELDNEAELDSEAEMDSEAELDNEAKVDNEAEVCWPYVGRTKFKKLVKKLKKVRKSRQYTTVWLYGTQGYGKSHLLAALVCYLAAQDERVVYIPDCRALLKDPVGYVRAALLFAWANDIPTQMEIITLITQDDIREFLDSQNNVILVIDQMTALKNSSNNPTEAAKCSDLYYWTMSLTTGHKSVLSTSANYREFHEQNQQQTSNLVVYAYGGFNRMEMDEWWKRHGDIKVTDDERSDFEDITGCIPLLLEKCVVSGKIDLTVAALCGIYHKAVGFVQRLRASTETNNFRWKWYCNYAIACFYRENVPSGYNEHPDLIDHRYFFTQPDEEGNEKGKYTCGLVRDTVADQLLEAGFNFADTNLLASLADFVKNPSMTGFIIEHAILSSIRLKGLNMGKGMGIGIGKGMALKTIGGCSVKTDVMNEPVLYRPQISNYAAIDGMIIWIQSEKNKGEKSKLLMVPIQITIQKSGHSDSHAAFLQKYHDWTKGLSEFDVELDFVWITPERREVIEHDAVWTTPKQRRAKKDNPEPKLISPKHIERWIPIEDVCAQTWRQYQSALEAAG